MTLNSTYDFQSQVALVTAAGSGTGRINLRAVWSCMTHELRVIREQGGAASTAVIAHALWHRHTDRTDFQVRLGIHQGRGHPVPARAVLAR